MRVQRVVGRREGLVALAVVAVFAAVAAPAFRGEMYLFDDLGAYHLPFRVFYQSQLERGESPAWHPGIYNGYDLHAEGQLGMAHPVHLVLYGVFPLATAFHAELILNAITAMAGMYLFLRRWVDRREAALAGAVAFALGGFTASHTHHPNIVAAAAHVPWLLWAIDGLARAQGRRDRALWGLALGLGTASQWLHNHPQFLWYSAMAEAGYALFVAGRMPSTLGRLVLWKGLGLLASGTQTLPTLAAIRGSIRADVTPGFLAVGSLPPLNLLQLVMPYLYQSRVVAPEVMVNGTPLGPALDYADWRTGEFGFALGMVPLALLIWLTTRGSRIEPRQKRILAWSAVVAVLAFVLGMGDYSPLFPWLIRVPTFGLFRVSARAVLLVDVALCIMTAVAVNQLALASEAREAADRAGWRVWLLPVVAAIVVVLAPWVASRYPGSLPPNGFASSRLHVLGLALGFAAAGLVFVAARGRPAAMTPLLLLLVAELGVGWWTYLRHVPPMRLEAYLKKVSPPPQAPPARLVSDDDRLTLLGYSLSGGYASLTPLNRPRPRIDAYRRAAGASWVEVVESEQTRNWTPVDAPMARARLVAQAHHAPTLDADLSAVDVATTALVNLPLPPLSGVPGTARVAADRPGRIVVRTDAPARQLLVLTERYDAGWRVDLDGRRTALVRVNNGFLGCVVPPGSHRLRFRYEPVSHAVGAWLTAAGLMTMFGYVVFVYCSGSIAASRWRGQSYSKYGRRRSTNRLSSSRQVARTSSSDLPSTMAL